MKVSYFPGCTLKTKAKDLDFYARKCAEVLGIELIEVPDWQCCGGVFVSSRDEIATKLSSVRALSYAHENERPLVTVCSACHNVIKQTNEAMKNDEAFAKKVNLYMAQEKDKKEYSGECEVLHYLELLEGTVGFDKIKASVKNPLTGKKIAAYYGCLLLRPGKVMAFDDVENPTIMENFIRALGAEPVIYPARNECCGGYIAMEDKVAAKKRSCSVIESAAGHGAEMIVTACPLCKYNLGKSGNGFPVIYLTELLAEALGVKEG